MMITLTEPTAKSEEKLTSTQQSVLGSLMLGHTVSEAASFAGVHRNTVHRWLKTDEHFQEARDQARQEAQRVVQAKLHDTATAAMECIEKCLEQGDNYVAEQLLKGLGCYGGKLKDVGSDEAVELATEALQHSALAEMFHVGPDLAGQFETTSAPEGRYASSENLQHNAPSRRSGTPVPDNQNTSGTECHDLQEHPTATSEDGYANLTSQQTTTMMALQTGQCVEQAADTAKTDAATVYQWLHGDCTFQAAMNRCAEERRQSVHARLQQLATLAADVVHHRITQGDGRLAVRLLKGLGYLSGAKRQSC